MEPINDLISVIVPVYNVENYLPDCLDSIIAQTYPTLEIILIDDGSTDNSGKICEEYAHKDCRITVVHQNNSGLSASRNVGLSVKTGEWIVFVDSDDFIHPDLIADLYCSARKNNTLISKCRYLFTRGSYSEQLWNNTRSDKKCVYHTLSSLEEMKAIISDDVWSVVWGTIYHKSILSDLSFATGYDYEDITFMAQVLIKVDTVTRIPYEYYAYRICHDSITHRKMTVKNFDLLTMTLKRMEIISDRFQSLSSLANERFWGITANMYNDALKEGAKDVADALYYKVKNEYRKNNYSPKIIRDKNLPLIRRISYACCGISFKTACAIKRLFFIHSKSFGFKIQNSYKKVNEKI